ncbi:NUDIX hydrolase [Alkanindiges hydrocarboniclasticus]|uniref:Phosphatase NudJ n=1 Tax=Alkanindiges hydrocarboniclasticus TaxID=1907941 RepID=A0A1S8CTW4_9GAMM|nr:NUDIX hydrolase [Alkanindiges hydrocarboniclasticus]ONG39869.1 NUDIX hydrolase [Alkanindiges hydrocarboniclasticus]
MSWIPHVTVATIVQDDQQRFLFVEEQSLSASHLVINQPAGHVEAHETLIEAAVRETLEETGWTVDVTHLLGIYTYTPPADPDCTYYRFCFLAKPLSHDAARPLDTGIEQALWMTLEALEETARARSPLVIRCVQDALQGKRYPLDIIFEQPLFNSSPDLLNA